MDTALDLMVRERREKRDRLSAQIATLDAEIRVLEEARARMGGTPLPSGARRAPVQRIDGAPRERALKREWIEMLRFIGGTGESGAHLDAMMAYSDTNSLGIARNTLRSQVSVYGDRGWVERIGQGRFRLTEAGAQKCGLKIEATNAEAHGAGHTVGLASEGDDDDISL